MDNSVSGMSNALAQNFSPATMNDGSSMHMATVMSNSFQPQPSSSVGGSEANAGDPSTPVVIKRRPGRPKGSGKKATIAGDSTDPATPKIKRPVGRPRKDGLPSGSVGPRRPSRPRKSAPAKLGANGPEVPFNGGYQPLPPTVQSHSQWQTVFSPSGSKTHHAPESNPPMGSLSKPSSIGGTNPIVGTYAIDPNLDRGDWVDLARTKPNQFLTTLLVSLSTPNPVSSVGSSVEEAFKSHLVSLAPNAAQVKGSQPIPSLYSILKTFWLPSSPAYFSLTASATTSRTPSEHRFLYWDPQPLVFNGIACPDCSGPLTSKGRIRSGPIKIYDLERPFFIIGCEYVCKSGHCVAATSPEGRKFASTDPSIMRSLPAKLKDEFPAHLSQSGTDGGNGFGIWDWRAFGVSKALWNMVRGALNAGLHKDTILRLIHDIQYGVPDDNVRAGEGAEEEEEEEEEDEEEELAHELLRSDTHLVDIQNGSAQNNDPAVSYNDAWGSNGVVDVDPSASAASGSNIMQAKSPSQVYGFPPQSGPYIAYPYAPYAYYAPQPAGSSAAASTSAKNENASASTKDESSLDQNQTQGSSSTPNALKRPFASFAVDTGASGSEASPALEPAVKRTRHCCKCGSQDCKGKGGRAFCMNACQDCGKLDCQGRNSRRPDKTCVDAWS